MKKAILNIKAFYISLFVVLFFPLGLMGQEVVNTQIFPGSAICFESNGMMMAVDIYPEFEDSEGKEPHPFAGLPYISAREKDKEGKVWNDMTIWWEATDKGFRSLVYDCYLKLDSINETYAVAMYKDPDGDGPGKPRAYSEEEATPIGYVDAQRDAKILCDLKDEYSWSDGDYSKSTSWYVGVISYNESVTYYTDRRQKNPKTYSHMVHKYYRPQYDTTKKTWVAGTNVSKRKLTKYDLIDKAGIKDLGDVYDAATIYGPGDITYSKTLVLGGVEFGKLSVWLLFFTWDINMNEMFAFFCPPTDAQAYMLKNFDVMHQKGASGRDLDEEGLQSVHTFTEVIYAKSKDKVNLRLQVEDTKAYSSGFWDDIVNTVVDDQYLSGFYRWFYYQNEDDTLKISSSLTHTKSITTSLFGTEEQPINYFRTNIGHVLLRNMGPGKTEYEMGNEGVKIACDVSNYSDGSFNFGGEGNKVTYTEPTLSYRMIYDIRPAKEMADQLDKCTTTPLESYTIVVPVPVSTEQNEKKGKQITIGPKYRWNLTRSNYYYTSSVTKIQRPYWYKNGKRFTPADTDIIDDRLISIVGPDEDGKVDTYTLKTRDGNAIIAEFKVIGRDINKVGPSNTPIDFPDGYDPTDPSSLTPAYTETFDRSSKGEFDQPLPWSDISYGFVYYNFSGSNDLNKKANASRGRKGSGGSDVLPHWSEYSFIINTTTGGDEIFSVNSHSSTSGLNCRYLYCSGTNTPGKVADFVINGDLCPASKIFLSVWVVHTYDVSKIEGNWITDQRGGASVFPNLNFVIIGIRNEGDKVTETPISTFTTGDLDTKGKWHHIFFEFETTQVDYDQYRIRIENNNASLFNIGNEFGIDDIRVYTTTKTAATVNQKFMGCPTWDVNKPTVIGKSNIALLRAELDNTPATGATMYYAWLKKEGVNDTIHLGLPYYIGQSQTSLYGTVDVNKGWTKENAPDQVKAKFYDDVNAYLETIKNRTNDFSDYFFTHENNELVLYIMHKDERFLQNEKYYSIVTTLDLSEYDEDGLIELYRNLQCGSLSYFEVLPYSRAFLAKKEGEGENVVYKKYGDYDFTEAITKHLADGETYNFVVEAYSPAVIDDRDTIVSYNCYADWLLVKNDAEKWNDAQKIITWRGGGNQPTLTSGNILKTSDGSDNSFQVENFSGPLHYIAIPDPTEAFIPDPKKPNVFYTPCAIPVEIYLYDSIPATLADPTINNNKVDVPDRPEEICNEPIIVRIPNSLEGKDNISLNLDIDYFDEYLFAEIAKYNEKENEKTQDKNLYPLNNIYLYDANGRPVATPIKFNITTTAKDENNQTLTLDLLKKDDDVAISGGHDFESGKKYHFAGHNQINGVTITPPFQFDVYVVPDEVEWTGAAGTAWHNDANWDSTNENEEGFIPLSVTNVRIPNTININKPVLNPSENGFEEGANELLKHDIVALTKDPTTNVLSDNLSATLNSCQDIYFEAGAQLVNQHMFNYERAFVDVPFTGTNFGKSTANYKIMSFPLRNVYRGDLYIPRNYDEKAKKDIGDGDFDFDFSQTDGQFKAVPVDNRAYNSFYVKAYDSAIKQNHVVNNNGKNEVDYSQYDEYNYENTSWSNPTSVLNFKFEEAHGYAVSLKATTAQSFVRLPKSATEYYLFMNFGNGNEKELQGSTWPKYEIPELQLKGDKRIRSSEGHKLVYDKDHGASVTFTNKVGNIFLIGNPFMTDMKVKKFLVDNNLKSNVYYTYSDGIINVTVTPTDADIIPPFGAMFVEGNSNTQAFTFTPEMMSDTESPTQQRAPRMVEERELLTITAEVDGARSRTYIEKDFAANNEYLDTEDADLLVLDADLTPISVYSVATGAALAYNSVTDMEFVPLGLLLVDSTIVAESVRFTFDGVDYFYDELYLYDALYNSYLPLIDGVALELEMPESGELRYFITDTKHNVGGGVTTSDDLVEGSKVCVFTTEGEACIIAEDIISEATVYDIAGRLIYHSDQISSSQHNISLPNGVYMLKVVVNSNLSTHKIILK